MSSNEAKYRHRSKVNVDSDKKISYYRRVDIDEIKRRLDSCKTKKHKRHYSRRKVMMFVSMMKNILYCLHSCFCFVNNQEELNRLINDNRILFFLKAKCLFKN